MIRWTCSRLSACLIQSTIGRSGAFFSTMEIISIKSESSKYSLLIFPTPSLLSKNIDLGHLRSFSGILLGVFYVNLVMASKRSQSPKPRSHTDLVCSISVRESRVSATVLYYVYSNYFYRMKLQLALSHLFAEANK